MGITTLPYTWNSLWQIRASVCILWEFPVRFHKVTFKRQFSHTAVQQHEQLTHKNLYHRQTTRQRRTSILFMWVCVCVCVCVCVLDSTIIVVASSTSVYWLIMSWSVCMCVSDHDNRQCAPVFCMRRLLIKRMVKGVRVVVFRLQCWIGAPVFIFKQGNVEWNCPSGSI